MLALLAKRFGFPLTGMSFAQSSSYPANFLAEGLSSDRYTGSGRSARGPFLSYCLPCTAFAAGMAQGSRAFLPPFLSFSPARTTLRPGSPGRGPSLAAEAYLW